MQKITNYIGVEPYNINTEYVITPHIGMSTNPNSNNVDAQDQILPTHEFHSLFQKMNNEQHIIYPDVIFRGKKIQMNHFTCSLLEVQVHVKLSHQCF
jgi:hypothetical protein